MERVTHKMVKILKNGPIMVKSGICGPILTPYLEDVMTIFRLISDNVEVVEVINGEEVKLTVSNFDKNNSKKVDEVKAEDKKIDPPQTTQNNNQQRYQNQNNFNKNQNRGNNNNRPQQPNNKPQVQQPINTPPVTPVETTVKTEIENPTSDIINDQNEND